MNDPSIPDDPARTDGYDEHWTDEPFYDPLDQEPDDE
jgi:hypothetical protein